VGVRPQVGPVRHYLLTQNTDPQAKTMLVYTAPDSSRLLDATALNALASALQQRLTYVLRQKLGGVYAVQVSGQVAVMPYRYAILQVVYTSDPTRVHELSAVVAAELDSMKTQGPSATELHDFKEAAKRNGALLVSLPEAWVQRLTSYVASGWPLDQLDKEQALADAVTVDDIRAMAQRLFTDPNSIQVVAMPQKYYNQPGTM
jgi:zinc protease